MWLTTDNYRFPKPNSICIIILNDKEKQQILTFMKLFCLKSDQWYNYSIIKVAANYNSLDQLILTALDVMSAE